MNEQVSNMSLSIACGKEKRHNDDGQQGKRIEKEPNTQTV